MTLPNGFDIVGGVDDSDGKAAGGRPSSGPLSGRLLSSRWRVGNLLGRGGMSAVYEATHRNGNRVAIKVLRVDLQANERTRRRFMREGYLANRVGHDGVVAVLDDDVTKDGAAFLVMELLEGMTVEQYCSARGGRLPQGEVLAIADAVLDILVAAHARKIIHRDIKPSNLFLTNSGGLKLLDFGIASFRETSGFLQTTGGGVLLGTPGFMAPEQARGQWKGVDARTDLWAVGALMFRLLTGRLVYETENSNEYLIAAATKSAPALASLEPSLPLGIVETVDRALKNDPTSRFQTAVEMQNAVRAECLAWPDCRIPSPPPPESLATRDESVSNCAEVEILDLTASRTPRVDLRRAVRNMRPFVLYGILGGVLALLYLDRRITERPSPTIETTYRTIDTLQVQSKPIASMTLHPDSIVATIEPNPAPTSSGQRFAEPTAASLSQELLRPGVAARTVGTIRAAPPPPHASRTSRGCAR